MGMIIEMMLFFAMIKLLLVTRKPFLCSGILTFIAVIFGLVFGYPFSSILINAAATFAYTSFYFWLLDRFGESVMMWLIILIGVPITRLLITFLLVRQGWID